MEKIVFALIMLMVLTTSTATHPSQNQKSGFQEVYTGTLMNMNGPARTTGFNLSIKDYTSDEDARAYLAMLVEGDQFDLLKRIQDLDLGFTSATGTVGRRLLIVDTTSGWQDTDHCRLRTLANAC